MNESEQALTAIKIASHYNQFPVGSKMRALVAECFGIVMDCLVEEATDKSLVGTVVDTVLPYAEPEGPLAMECQRLLPGLGRNGNAGSAAPNYTRV